MTTQVLLPIKESVFDRVLAAVRIGLSAHPKTLPAWLFYDDTGSRLFEDITELPEYYVTRTERLILANNASSIIAQAAGDIGQTVSDRFLRIIELGAGSAVKTRLLLAAAAERQGSVVYEPVDVSAAALELARESIESEMPEVEVVPRVMDYTRGLDLDPAGERERRLVLYIGSSIGNFEPHVAERVLRRVHAHLNPGDSILLGVDLAKDEETLVPAYDDAAGVTAAFNLNLLTRLNRELGCNFDSNLFAHRAVWNPAHSRIEMHLESQASHTVQIPALNMEAHFAKGETIHTENSYKFAPGAAESLLANSGFIPTASWTDPNYWFTVHLAHAE